MKVRLLILLAAVVAVLPTSSPSQTQAPAAPATVSSIPADQQPTKEQMSRLFEVMRLRNEMAATMKAIPTMVQQQLRTQMSDMYSNLPDGAQPTAEQKQRLNDLLDKYMERAAQLYSVDDMMGDIIGIYQRHMTRTDVDAYIAFYNSPAGQHLLDAQPMIMKEYMPLVMKRVETASTQLTEEMTKDARAIVKTPAAK